MALSVSNVISGFLTVTLHVLLTPSVVTVIVAVPFLTAVTFPDASTVATLFLFVFHLGMLLDVDVTESLIVSLRKRETELLFSLTVGFLTVTLQLTDDLSTVAVIVAEPGFLAVITPYSSTEATLDLFDLKETGCPVDEVAFNRKDVPFSREMLLALSSTTVFFTVIRQLASPFWILAVMVAEPAFLAVIFP